MTDQKNQINETELKQDKIATISYIYEMVLVLKLMAIKIDEPLLSLLLEIVENESITLLKNNNTKNPQEDGTSETKPPE